MVDFDRLITRFRQYDGGPHEANFLKLDCSKLKTTFGWKPHWNLDKAIEKVVEWSKCWVEGGDVRACMDKEIEELMVKDLLSRTKLQV